MRLVRNVIVVLVVFIFSAIIAGYVLQTPAHVRGGVVAQPTATPSDVQLVFDKLDVGPLGHASVEFSLTNRTARVVKYVSVRVKYYNEVNDVVTNEIGGADFMQYKLVGPIKSGETRRYGGDKFFNVTTASCKMHLVAVEYMDGTVQKYTDEE